MLRLVFCGTPDFAVPCLEAVLTAGHHIELVLAQPDRPQGRGMKLTAPPVKMAAEKHGIAVMQPEKIKSNALLQHTLHDLKPDAIVVVAYGRILPQWMLNMPRYGCINVHASLLPKYRGAAPIQWALARGEKVTGITTMQMDAGLDTGDMLLQREVTIAPDWRAPELAAGLSQAGTELLVETLTAVQDQTLRPRKQDNAAATLAPLLSREDARVDWSRSAKEIHDRWRGFYPWPGCMTLFRGAPLQLKRLRIASGTSAGGTNPGECDLQQGRWLVSCSSLGTIEILEVQTPGKRVISAAEFAATHHVTSGERLV